MFLSLIKNTQKSQAKKRSVTITGTLTNILTPGLPAIYLYQGTLIRTSAVEAILESAPDHVRFETKDIVYTISSFHQPGTGAKKIA